MSCFPYHRDYGLPDSVRLKAIETAKTLGCARAARIHNLATSTVYRWMRDLRETHNGDTQ